jgi:hypothetical protein
MAAQSQRSSGDYSVGFSMGNQLQKKGVTYGYTVNLSYKSSTEFFSHAEFGRYGLDGDPNMFELVVREYQIGITASRVCFLVQMPDLPSKRNHPN